MTLEEVCEMMHSPQLGDDALIYAGSSTWDQWQNHVPAAVVALWPQLSRETRIGVYLTANAVTFYNDPASRRSQSDEKRS